MACVCVEISNDQSLPAHWDKFNNNGGHDWKSTDSQLLQLQYRAISQTSFSRGLEWRRIKILDFSKIASIDRREERCPSCAVGVGVARQVSDWAASNNMEGSRSCGYYLLIFYVAVEEHTVHLKYVSNKIETVEVNITRLILDPMLLTHYLFIYCEIRHQQGYHCALFLDKERERGIH